MITFIIVILVGWTSYYASPDLFPLVIENRQAHLAYPYLDAEPDNIDCYAAGRTADEIGNIVYIRSERTDWIKCWIVDVAGISDGTYDWMVANNIHYEVAPHTQLRLRGSLGGGVKVKIGKEVTLWPWLQSTYY